MSVTRRETDCQTVYDIWLRRKHSLKGNSMDLIAQAESLAPLLRETAREAEINRKPLDHVIDAVWESGLFALMVPKKFGGHEADLDTFFEVVLTLSRADASMGWITGFYIEHNLWLFNYPEDVTMRGRQTIGSLFLVPPPQERERTDKKGCFPL